jgi:phosphatidylserine/phosphatidylglycerophosphate/cardiolipin synthase-like enzyme
MRSGGYASRHVNSETMRQRKVKNGITLKVYAGTTGVLLSFNVTEDRRDGLLGFAIRRKFGSGDWRWLRGLLKFPSETPPDYLPVDSNIGPIQKFRWSDYSVYPDRPYSYAVEAVYGTPDNLTYVKGPTIALRTEALHKGDHQVVFNRAVAASQAYARKDFGNTNPDDESDPLHKKARNWLTRGMRQKIESFIKEAKDDRYALDVAIYEFEYPPFVELLQEASARGVPVRVIYHAKKKDHQTEVNEEVLAPLPDFMKKARVTTAIFHQKFILLKKKNAAGEWIPQRVLMGTSNFTPNGLWRQANVMHAITDKALTKDFQTLFEQLMVSEGRGDTKIHINANHPLETAKDLFAVFCPRSRYPDIDLLVDLVQNATSEVFICSAFNVHDRILDALENGNPDLIRYGLQNNRSRITGFHRNRSFTATAFLKEGLEGFLQESSKGQRGNIYIHLKTLITDFSTDNPTVVVGSHNFSKPASDKNDENFVVIKGNTGVADTYFCEMMRLYDHYRFRYNAKKSDNTERSPMTLATTNDWTNSYFDPDNLKFQERVRFSQ